MMFATTEEAEENLRNYLSKYGKDIVYRDNIIYLYRKAYEKRWHIFDFLDRRESYKGFFLFRPDLTAGLNRIEVSKVYGEEERCLIAKQISEDIKEKECQTEDDKCRIAKEITENVISRECTTEIPAPVRIGAVSLRSLDIEPIGFYLKPRGLTGKDIDIYYEVSPHDYDTLIGKTLLSAYLEYENKPIDIFVTDRKRLMASVQISPQEVRFMEKPPGERYKLSLPSYVLDELVEWV